MQTFYIDKQGAAHIEKPEGWCFEVEDYSLLDASMVRNWNDTSDHLLASINADGVPLMDIIKKSAFDKFGVEDLPEDIFPRVALSPDTGWAQNVVRLALSAKKQLKKSKITVSLYTTHNPSADNAPVSEDFKAVEKLLEKTRVKVGWVVLLSKSLLKKLTPEQMKEYSDLAAEHGGEPYTFTCGGKAGE